MSAACAPGSLLLQPDKLRRVAAADSDDALVDDLLVLVGRVAADAARGGTVLAVLAEAVDAAVTRMVQRAGPGLERAMLQGKDLLQPLLSGLAEVGGKIGEGDDPGEVVDALLDVLGQVAGILSGLTIDNLRALVATALHVLQQELGLTTAAVEAEVWALFDDVIARLDAVPAEADVDVRRNRLAIACILRRLRAYARGRFHLPALDAEAISLALFRLLRGTDLAATLDQVACAGKGVGQATGLAKDLVEALRAAADSSGLDGRVAVAAVAAGDPPARDTYLWYPSWLLGEEVWVKAGPGPVMRGKDQLFAASTFDWTAVPGAKAGDAVRHYTFGNYQPDTMESWARNTAWIANFLESALHLIRGAGQKSHFVGDLFLGGLSTAAGTVKLAKGAPTDFLLGPGLGFCEHLALAAPAVGAVLAGTLQGRHTSAAGGKARFFWFIVTVFDALDALKSFLLPSALRDAILSGLTLHNYSGPKDPPSGTDDRPDNRAHIAGVSGLVVLLFRWLLVKALPREDYAVPFYGSSEHQVRSWFLHMVLAGTAFAIMGGLAGAAVGEIVAWAGDWSLVGKTILDAITQGLTAGSGEKPDCFPTWLWVTTIIIGVPVLWSARTWVTYYEFGENDTGGGTYNPVGPKDYRGYPKNDASPYRLPWEKDRSILCIQGNQGFFSHNFVNPSPQVYAFDFGLDQGDDILAARAGTVVDFFDWVPDDQDVDTPAGDPTAPGTTTDNWNFVAIRHDADATHDRGPGGGAATTYAVYGHGRQGSVRAAFGGAAAKDIIGQPVPQGKRIMSAGSTGISRCNHVHMHVCIGPPPRAGAIKRKVDLGPTIPFVFREVNYVNPLADDGVPKSRKWYTSDNTKVP